MVRPLTAADTLNARELLRRRPLHNLFLDYVVAAGVLGRVSGFFGWPAEGRLAAILMIGPLGGTALEVVDPRAFAPLAVAAAHSPLRPRHIVGSEDVYAPYAGGLRWTRRETVLVASRSDVLPPRSGEPRLVLEPARAADVDELTANSAEQHREDLHDDRAGDDESGFRERHAKDVREGRWWVARARRRIVFQVHVGAANPQTVQLGGVFVPHDARARGHATAGVRAMCARLFERHTRVTLYCDEANEGARRVYQRVGFQHAYCNRSYLLDEPLAREERRGYG